MDLLPEQAFDLRLWLSGALDLGKMFGLGMYSGSRLNPAPAGIYIGRWGLAEHLFLATVGENRAPLPDNHVITLEGRCTLPRRYDLGANVVESWYTFVPCVHPGDPEL